MLGDTLEPIMPGGQYGGYRENAFNFSDLDASRHDLWAVITERTRLVDLAVVSIVPTVMILVYLLPSGLKQGLVLDYTDPTIITSYTSHFVHVSTTHLAVNLVGYILVISVTYLLALASGQRKQFLLVYAIFTLSMPFALSGMNLLWPWQGVGLGLSGITMAFVGYLPLVLFEFVGTRFDLPVTQRHSVWLFLITVATAASISLPVAYSTPLIVTAIAVTAISFWRIHRYLTRESLTGVKQRLDIPGNVEFTLLGGSVVILYQFVSFSPDLLINGGTLNVYTHGIGLSFGFAITYLGIWMGWLHSE
jgi:hypothetical protein